MWLLETSNIAPLPTEPFVGVNFWTIIFAWINLLILYLAFKKFLFVPIKNMIDQRQKEIDDMYSDAESSRTAASMRSRTRSPKSTGTTEVRASTYYC